MFTGLVEALGRVRTREGTRLEVFCGFAPELAIGESVSVNGVCLTVEAADADGFAVTTVPTTLRRTTLGALAAGDPVNLERALGATARLGGHIVQGHADGVGTLAARQADGAWDILRFTAPPAILRYCVPRGAIAVDGVSLTVTDRALEGFSVAIVPHTARMTTLGTLRPGGHVNLEADILAKYVEGLLRAPNEGGAAGA